MNSQMSQVGAIALNTYRELIRSKVLYATVFFALVLVVISALLGSVTIGEQVKVIKDFGLFAVSIFSVAFAVIAGSALLSKELSRKTIYNILAKPVQRWQFLVGKFLGMFGTVAVLAILMGLGLSIFVYFFEDKLDIRLFEAYLYILLELAIVCAAAIFFSCLVVTPMLSGLFTFCLFLAGRSADYILAFAAAEGMSGFSAGLLKATYVVLPQLSLVNVGNDIVYGLSTSGWHLMWAFLYTLAYIGALLVIGAMIFGRREFN